MERNYITDLGLFPDGRHINITAGTEVLPELNLLLLTNHGADQGTSFAVGDVKEKNEVEHVRILLRFGAQEQLAWVKELRAAVEELEKMVFSQGTVSW